MNRNATVEQRNPTMKSRFPFGGNKDDPATSNTAPPFETRTPKNEELTNDQVIED
jgi:hypothetical protein